MKPTLGRSQMQTAVKAVFSSVARLRTIIDPVALPEDLLAWLRNLQLLKGVPFNYLVPDEGMLPAESIRFFYLDPNWVDALIDGAFSIGRNLTRQQASPILALDEASQPRVRLTLRVTAAALRSANLGVPAPQTSLKKITGFLLRSSLVAAYPGMGVYAYDAAGGDLKILRFEKLGQSSDTMICLIDGDATRIDVHEAPEQLHYGIDGYTFSPENGVEANKQAHPFTIEDGVVTIDQNTVPVNISDCFRADAPRTMRIAKLAATLKEKTNPSLPYLNAAQMGFEMTQGVGLVSFKSSGGQS
ncbi:MAG TPA: hypothetical protein VE178_11705 [Silvibacterium sp.]|nr:hypothetical protein [Silvibacterium sp.]